MYVTLHEVYVPVTINFVGVWHANVTEYIGISTISSLQDLKDKIKETFSIPVHDVRITYRSGTSLHMSHYALKLQRYEMPIDDSSIRYIGDDAHIYVHNARYTTVEGVEAFGNVVSDLETFLTTHIVRSDADMWVCDHELIYRTLNLAHNNYSLYLDLLVPWKSITTVNNRLYFYHMGITQKFIRILELIRAYHMSDVKFTNYQLIALLKFRCVCLEILWNSSETKQDRTHWLKYGALETSVNCFLDSESVRHFHLTNIGDIGLSPMDHLSIGSIVQYTEYENVRMSLAQNGRFMRLFVVRLEHLPLPTQPGFDLYFEQLMFNTAMCILSSPASHKHFITSNCHTVLVELSYRLVAKNSRRNSDGNVASPYFTCLSLAFIVAFSSRELSLCSPEPKKRRIHQRLGCMFGIKDEPACFIDQAEKSLERFLLEYYPKSETRFEQNKGYVWVTMSPFIELAWSWNRDGCCRSSPESETVRHCLGNVQNVYRKQLSLSQLIGLFALTNVLADEANLDIIFSEDTGDFVSMLSWYFPDLKCLRDFKLHWRGAPTLQNICRAKLMVLGALTPHAALHVLPDMIMDHIHRINKECRSVGSAAS